MTWLLVVAGAAVGAPLRYLTHRFVQSRHGTAFAWGTLAANVLGSLVLGVLAGATVSGVVGTAGADPVLAERLHLLIGTGLCGALTTYSTFSYETLQLTRGGARLYALLNVALTLTAGVGAYCAGGALAHAVWV